MPVLDQSRTLKLVFTPIPPHKLFIQFQGTQEAETQYVFLVQAYEKIQMKMKKSNPSIQVQTQAKHYSTETCLGLFFKNVKDDILIVRLGPSLSPRPKAWFGPK